MVFPINSRITGHVGRLDIIPGTGIYRTAAGSKGCYKTGNCTDMTNMLAFFLYQEKPEPHIKTVMENLWLMLF